ncbi:MAG: phospholipid-binding protein MlaC [Rickettsiaceae bacterium]
MNILKSNFFRNFTFFKYLIITACCIFTQNIYAKDITEAEAATQYFDQLIHKTINILQDNSISKEEKSKKVRQIIQKEIDAQWMAKYVLGRNIRDLTKEKKQEFRRVYAQYISAVYSDLIQDYTNQQVSILRTQELDRGEFIITTEIFQSNSQSGMKASYLIRNISSKNNEYIFKIADVIVGVSTIASQRTEFNNIIINTGIEGLIEELKKKI